MNTRQPFIDKLKVLRLPKIDLAGLANVRPARISSYIRGTQLQVAMVEKIERAIVAVEAMHNRFPKPFRIETHDPDAFWEFYGFCDSRDWFSKDRADIAMEIAGTLIAEKLAET